MRVADIDVHHPLPFTVLDDSAMGQRPGHTLTQVGKAAAIPLATGTPGYSEDLRE
jgi:hypothetical protein